ncbi:hypothetical protein ACFV17_06720, partial [Streptomyces sp. NPDC059656]
PNPRAANAGGASNAGGARVASGGASNAGEAGFRLAVRQARLGLCSARPDCPQGNFSLAGV